MNVRGANIASRVTLCEAGEDSLFHQQGDSIMRTVLMSRRDPRRAGRHAAMIEDPADERRDAKRDRERPLVNADVRRLGTEWKGDLWLIEACGQLFLSPSSGLRQGCLGRGECSHRSDSYPVCSSERQSTSLIGT